MVSTVLQVAERAPNPLKAIITLCSSVDRYAEDIHYKGDVCLTKILVGDQLCGHIRHVLQTQKLLVMPEKDLDPEAERRTFLPLKWLAHQNRDSYWKHGSVCENYKAIKAATLALGGWGDAYKNAVSSLVENLSCPVKGIVGPWVHKYPHLQFPSPELVSSRGASLVGSLVKRYRSWHRE